MDFVIEYKNELTPIEVKEGHTGKMKSLHLFMKEKHSQVGIKLSSQNFQTNQTIQSIPLYAVERLFSTLF